VTYPNLADNLSDLRLKAHVKHAISFINDKVGCPTQVGLIVLKQVNQSAWSRNTDLSTCQSTNQNAPYKAIRIRREHITSTHFANSQFHNHSKPPNMFQVT